MKNALSYLVFALVASTSSAAFSRSLPADPCTDQVCADGEVCEVVVNDCAPCLPTEPGQEPIVCDACNSDGVAVCVPAPPPQCTSDTDCNGDDVCVTYSFGSCEVAVAPLCNDPMDPSCDAPVDPPVDPPVCEEESESICVPRYAAPCQVAADCGVGFTCEMPELCSCTSGGSTCSSEDPNCDPLPPEEECMCAPSTGDAYCQLIPVECDSDVDCDNGFTCVEEPAFRDEFPCQAGDNCSSDPIPANAYCLPSGYSDWAAQGGTANVDGRQPESAERRNGFFSNAGDDDHSDEDAETGGCQVTQSPTGLAGFSILLLGLMFGTRRKRK